MKTGFFKGMRKHLRSFGVDFFANFPDQLRLPGCEPEAGVLQPVFKVAEGLPPGEAVAP